MTNVSGWYLKRPKIYANSANVNEYENLKKKKKVSQVDEEAFDINEIPIEIVESTLDDDILDSDNDDEKYERLFL